MTQPGLSTPPSRRTISWKRGLIAAGVLGSAFLLARSCTPEPEPAAPQPPPPRTLSIWEQANTIAVTFDTRGNIYGAVGVNYLLSNRDASAACTRALPSDQSCFGILARESDKAGKACVGVGVDRLDPLHKPSGASSPASYVVVEGATPQDVRPKLDAACAAQPQQCVLSRGIFCNYN